MTPKQQRFVEEYLVDLNATAAALRAGYSKKTAYSIGHENLSKPEIEKAIQKGRDKLSRATGITVERVANELGDIAFSPVNEDIRTDHKLSGLDKLMRHLGGYKDSLRIDANLAVTQITETFVDDKK